MTSTEFLQAVTAEVEALKIHATPEELAKLDFEENDPNSSQTCNYGQIAGDCFSERAHMLIKLCAAPFRGKSLSIFYSLENILERGNAAEIDNMETHDMVGHRRAGFTPMELFISKWPSQNESILAYLKGEIETLPELHL